MHKYSDRSFCRYVCGALMTLFFFSNIVPVLGPAFIANIFGLYENEYIKHGLSAKDIIASMVAGQALFYITFILAISSSLRVYHLDFSWQTVLILCIISCAYAARLFFRGRRKSQLIRASIMTPEDNA
ncbi:MAG: hypothetical protein WC453_04025 [Patescibacteria group bacterium]